MMEKSHSFKSFLACNFLALLGFFCCYIAPFLLMSIISSFKGTNNALSGWGIFATVCICFSLILGLKKLINKMQEGFTKQFILSLFTAAFWAVILWGIMVMERCIGNFSNYWYLVGISLLIGRIFYILNGMLKAGQIEFDSKNETVAKEDTNNE